MVQLPVESYECHLGVSVTPNHEILDEGEAMGAVPCCEEWCMSPKEYGLTRV